MHKILYGLCLSYSSKKEAGIGAVIILIKWRPRAIHSLTQSRKFIENSSLLTLSPSGMNEVRVGVGYP